MGSEHFPPVSGRGWRLAGDVGLGLLAVFAMLRASVGTTMVAGPFVAVICVLAIATLMLRHRALPAAAVLAGTLVAFFPQSGLVLAVVAYTVGFRDLGSRRRVVLLIALAAVPAIVTPVGLWVLGLAGASVQVWTVAAVVVVCGAVPALVGVLVRQRNWLAAAQQDAAENLRLTQLFAVSDARLRERSRIAIEMHDVLGHRLSLIALHAGGLALAVAPADPDAHRAAQLIRATASQALDEMRGVLGLLQSPELADTMAPEDVAAGTSGVVAGTSGVVAGTGGDTGTRADVSALVAGSRAAGVEVRLDWTGEDLTGVDEAIRRAVHRIVREALTNVHKHAPGAAVSVRIDRASDRVRVEVSNGPHPANAAAPADPGRRAGQGGAGLVGLDERTRLLGGTLRAEPRADGGFTVQAEMPLDASGRAAAAIDTAPAHVLASPGSAAKPSPALQRSVIIAVGAVVGLLALGGLGTIITGLAQGFGSAGRDPAGPRVGMTQAEFMAGYGVNDPLAQLAARGQEPPPPDGATCLYQAGKVLMQDPLGVNRTASDTITVHRYCFVADRLVEDRDLNLNGRVG